MRPLLLSGANWKAGIVNLKRPQLNRDPRHGQLTKEKQCRQFGRKGTSTYGKMGNKKA